MMILTHHPQNLTMKFLLSNLMSLIMQMKVMKKKKHLRNFHQRKRNLLEQPVLLLIIIVVTLPYPRRIPRKINPAKQPVRLLAKAVVKLLALLKIAV